MTDRRAIPLGPFELDAPLGRGGMGEVWGGRHVGQDVPVAVKVLTSFLAWDETFREQFRNEVRAVARLDHPSVVMVFDHGVVSEEAAERSEGQLAEGAPYLVMEKLDGALSGSYRPQSWVAARAVLEVILDAIAHAHARDVIHRDIKLGNVLVSQEGEQRMKLADFGIARAVESIAPTTWEKGTIAGTPQYMAPEQILGSFRDQGPWTDLYSLGCVAWRLVTGQAPFGGRRVPPHEVMRGHLEEPPPPFRPRIPVPAGIEEWLRTLLAKHPSDRFAFAADAHHALRALEAADHVSWMLPAAPELADGEEPSDLVSSSELPTLSALQTDWSAAPEGALDGDAALEAIPRRPPMSDTWHETERAGPPVALNGAGLGLYDLRPVPLVGRVAERDALWRELRRVDASGEPRIVCISGPAGAGKSRLAEWLGVRARESGAASALRARHAPMRGPGQGLPAMVSTHLKCDGLSRADLLARLLEVLRERVVADADESAPLHEAMALTAFMLWEQKTRTERAVTVLSFLARATAARPAIVWLDDVQWGEDSLDLVADVLATRAGKRIPVLFVLTAQDEAMAQEPAAEASLKALCDQHGAFRLQIGMLGRAERHELVEKLLGLDEELVRRVEERTAGNPLFAVQLVGDWVQRGVLEAGDRGFRLRSGEEAPLPDDIHAAWRGRLESMISEQADGVGREQAWRALSIAAALGGEVVDREWEGACAAAGVASPRKWVEPLLSRRLAVGTPAVWSFVHGMLGESLERRAREEGEWALLHRACAEMIAGRYGAGVRGARERLGRHLLEAGAFDEAIEPLLEAAAERCQSADFDRAQAILDERERALDAIGVEPNASARLAGDIERMRALARKGDPEGAAALASRIEMLTDGDPRYAVMYGDIERMRALFAHKAGETTTSLARYREAISHYRVAGDQPGIGRSLHGLAEVHAVRGEMEEAETRYREALEAIQPTDDLQYRAHAMIGLGNVVRQRGRFDEGAALIDGAMKMYRQIGDRLGEAMSANYLGELARQRGDLAAAEAHYQEAAEGTRAVGTRDALIIELNLCLVRIARGAYDRARSVLLATLAELDDAGLSGFAAFAHSALVACAAAKGDWEAFDLHVDRAERILAASRIVDDDVAWPIELAARLAGEAGQAERATRAGAIGAAQRKALAGGT